MPNVEDYWVVDEVGLGLLGDIVNNLGEVEGKEDFAVVKLYNMFQEAGMMDGYYAVSVNAFTPINLDTTLADDESFYNMRDIVSKQSYNYSTHSWLGF